MKINPKISKPICQIAVFRKKLKADWMRGMLPISQVWVCSITTWKLRYDCSFSRYFVQGCLLGNAGVGGKSRYVGAEKFSSYNLWVSLETTVAMYVCEIWSSHVKSWSKEPSENICTQMEGGTRLCRSCTRRGFMNYTVHQIRIIRVVKSVPPWDCVCLVPGLINEIGNVRKP